MKTNYVSAIVMLSAGGVYCLFGIYNGVPLMDFCIQLLSVLIIFWIIGGIIRMVLDKYMGEIEDKNKEETEEESEEDEENSEGSDEESEQEKDTESEEEE